MEKLIIEKLKTVYDPEFPLIDLYNLWLIYNVKIDEEEKKIYITMTFTTSACPMADMIEQLVENAILEVSPDFFVIIEITFDPPRIPEMIKDEDIRQMFM